MSEQAIRYLRENKGKYPLWELSKTLHGAGYGEDDICASIREVFPEEAGAVPPPPIPPANQLFWNFQDKKTYIGTGQKWLDFFFGIFAPGLAIWMIALVFSVLGFRFFRFFAVFPLIFIGLIIYLWNRRRFISYGMLFQGLAYPVLAILFFSLFFHF
jgi:hypothetical protein